MDISIPYGSIKSKDVHTHCHHLYHISIPYGSIKSGHGCPQCYKTIRFQFLMVQLKGFGQYFYNVQAVISIPYGSIKRPQS